MTDQNLLDRLKHGLSKTRGVLAEGIQQDTAKSIDEIITDVEDGLLMADVGIETTDKLMTQLRALVEKQRKTNARPNILELLSQCIFEILEPSNKPMLLGRIKPFSILVVGVNGAGKTTTIGKLARRLKKNRKSVMLAAGDTFRAAAVEQLIAWG